MDAETRDLLERLGAGFGALRTEITTLRGEVGTLRDEVDTLRDEVGALRVDARALDAKFDRAVVTLAEDIATNTQRIDRLRSDLTHR